MHIKATTTEGSAQIDTSSLNTIEAKVFTVKAVADPNAKFADKILGNKSEMVYYWAGCTEFTKISKKNRVVFASPEDAEANGYSTAEDCPTPVPDTKPAPDSERNIENGTLEAEDNSAKGYSAPAYSIPSQYQPIYTTKADSSAVTEVQPVATPYSVPNNPTYQPNPPIVTESPSIGRMASAMCNDGSLSYSTTNQGTCSSHGGVSAWLNGTPSVRENSAPSYSTPPSSSNDYEYRPKTVQVRGYTRKDGTYVAPHTRSAPRKRN